MSVYFARIGEYMKVGYSADPVSRAAFTRTDRTIKPVDIDLTESVDLIGWYPGDRAAEREAHHALREHHVVGEWFHDVSEIHEHLRAQSEAVLVREISALALFAILKGSPVAEATAAWPLNDDPHAIASIFDAPRVSLAIPDRRTALKESA